MQKLKMFDDEDDSDRKSVQVILGMSFITVQKNN